MSTRDGSRPLALPSAATDRSGVAGKPTSSDRRVQTLSGSLGALLRRAPSEPRERVSRLCRIRHKREYAEARIMPS